MNNPINNQVFDTRDLIEYKEYLEDEICDIINKENEGTDEYFVDIDECIEWLDNQDVPKCYIADNEFEHYNEIKDFCEELGSADDFEYGEGVIHEDYFAEYCEDLLKDCGYIPQDLPSWIVLDFNATADNMKQDYISAVFENKTYYIR